ncbi:ABC transporter substrate-binding protein [Gordonia spumicola]|uniref:ABC transporter substrate-binding protein n=1 Tax=Gordonia spumicola TaxID=589161 RepID=A0A7I9VBJ5_9ACTN|nr:ABC transporter substrate-binding protein [Gordonia spumicola]
MIGRSRVGAAFMAALLVAVAGCSTAPIETDAAKAAKLTASLRTGPSTATLPTNDIVPVVTDPAASAKADRIVAIDRNGTLGAIVFSLGLGSHVVGRDKSTTFPAARAVPVVTDAGHAINTERVLDTAPTIVLTGTDSNPAGAVDALRRAGLDVVQFSSERSVASTPGLIRSVAAALGVPDAGERLVARTQAQIAEAQRTIPDLPSKPKIAFLYIRGEYLLLLAGPGSGADDLIDHLGGVDAGTASGLTAAFTTVSAENLMAADPDVILVMTQGAESVGGMDKVLALPAIAQTNAGRSKRIVEMDETQILMFGPDTGLVMGALAKAIYA